MKKLSGLIALLMCIVIGGVYANWAYAQTDDIPDKYVELNITIPDAVIEGENGVYEITSTAQFVVRELEGSDRATELVVEPTADATEAKLMVKFTPTEAATIQIKENAVPTEIAFKPTAHPKFKATKDADSDYYHYDATNGEEVEILTYKNLANGEFNANVQWTAKRAIEGDETSAIQYFYAEYDAAWLLEQVSLTKVFVLDNQQAYNAFAEAVRGVGTITVKVTDGKNIK